MAQRVGFAPGEQGTLAQQTPREYAGPPAVRIPQGNVKKKKAPLQSAFFFLDLFHCFDRNFRRGVHRLFRGVHFALGCNGKLFLDTEGVIFVQQMYNERH